MRRIPNLAETAIIGSFFLLGNVGSAVYALNGTGVSPIFLTLYYVGVAWAFAAWIIADRRRLGMPISVDYGWYFFQLWMLVLPYHVVRTRGWRGCGLVVGFVALFVVTYVIAVIVWSVAK